ncbi:MAG: hypothetical protein AAGH76_05925 [Pseudomonadota bacterium]
MRAVLCAVVLVLATATGAAPIDPPVAYADTAPMVVASRLTIGNRSLLWIVRLPTTKPIPLLSVPIAMAARTALLHDVQNPAAALHSTASATPQRLTRER